MADPLPRRALCAKPCPIVERLLIDRRSLLAAALAAAGTASAQTPPPRPRLDALAPGLMRLQAVYGGSGKPVTEPLTWRVFTLNQGDPILTATSTGVEMSLALPPAEYMVHVAFGLAAATRRVTLTPAGLNDKITLNAGGLILKGKLAEVPIAADRQTLAVYIPSPRDSESRLVSNALKPGQLLVLPEGTYHVVSTYGGSNSVVRADITIQSGKVTEATMNHRAASVTLKLVRQAGGIAVANTNWTVQTPGGDVIAEALGAFPTMLLAEGEYDVFARNDGREFTDKMKVVSGVNRDHEVVMR